MKIDVLGNTVVLRKLPPWATDKSKSKMGGFTVGRMPYTAFAPTKGQLKAQLALAELGASMRGRPREEIVDAVRSQLSNPVQKAATIERLKKRRYAEADSNISRMRALLATT